MKLSLPTVNVAFVGTLDKQENHRIQYIDYDASYFRNGYTTDVSAAKRAAKKSALCRRLQEDLALQKYPLWSENVVQIHEKRYSLIPTEMTFQLKNKSKFECSILMETMIAKA